MRRPALFALALLAAPLFPAGAQMDLTGFARLDTVVAAEMLRTRTPGAAIAVVWGDSIAYEAGSGTTSAEGGHRVFGSTLFRIASVTKVFTAATLLELAAAKHVDLAAPIDTLLGALPDPLRTLTPHQLLSHTAGLQFGPIIPGGPDPAAALAQSVNRIPPRVAFTKPGEIFSYSNIGYEMAGRLIEVVSGRSYADAVRTTILRPMEMPATRFDTAGFMKALIAEPTLDSGVVTAPAGGAESWPFAGLYSNVEELSHFAIAFMNGGQYLGKRVMSRETIARISAPATPFVSGEGDYGYGVRVYRHRGLDVVEHGGFVQGYRSLLYMVPAKRIAVIVLANRSGRRPYDVVDAALDDLIPNLPPAPPLPAEIPLSADEMARYAGTYAGGAIVRLSIDAGVLTMHMGPASLPIHKLATGGFVAGEGDARNRLAFVTAPDGSVQYLHYNMRAFRRE